MNISQQFSLISLIIFIIAQLAIPPLFLVGAVETGQGGGQRKRVNGIHFAATILQKFRRVQKLAAHKVDRKHDDLIAHIMTPYGTPEPFSRIVKVEKNKKKNGHRRRLVTVDESMQKILDFVELKLGHSHPKMAALLEEDALPPQGCFLSFHFDKNIGTKAFRFDVGTRVSEEEIGHLELFEERETDRKMILDKRGVEKGKKKGELMGGNWMKLIAIEGEENGEAEKGNAHLKGEMVANQQETEKKVKVDNADDEDDEEEEEKKAIKLNTYASLGAIQKGAAAFGPDATLDMRNMPELDTIKNKKLRASVEDFFARLLDACDGKMDMVMPADIERDEDFDFSEFLNRIKENEGKMKSQSDFDTYGRDLRQMMDKIVRSMQAASDYERAEMRELVEKRKAEFDATASLDTEELEKVRGERKQVYEFLKTVKFAINARPSMKEFKQLSFEEYEELDGFADNFEGKIGEMIGELEAKKKLNEEEGKMLMECGNDEEKMKTLLNSPEWQEKLSENERYELLELVGRPKLANILRAPLSEKLESDECRGLKETVNDSTAFQKELSQPKLQRKLSPEEEIELRECEGKPAKLRELLEGKMTEFHRKIGDSLIHGRRHWYGKAGNWMWEVGKKLGEWVGGAYKFVAKHVFRQRSKEVTSAEAEEKQKTEAQNQRKLNRKRREVLKEAVETVRQFRGKCNRLSGAVNFAIYGKGEKVAHQKDVEEKEKMVKATATQDLRARLGAQAMNAVLNTKRFPEGHALAVLMSVGGSGLIGIVLDVLMVPLIILGMTGVAGPIPFIGAVLITIVKVVIKPLLESATPLLAETFDSAIIKRYLDSLEGGKFWKGVKNFKKTLGEAYESGKIASFGSIFYNFVMLSSNPWMLPVQLVANVIATVTSAAQLPIELRKTRDRIIKGIHHKMDSGFFHKLNEKENNAMAQRTRLAIEEGNRKFWGKIFPKKLKNMHPSEARNAAYMSWLERETWRTMEVEQSTRLVINSMGIGPIISSVIFLFMQYFQAAVPSAPTELVNGISVMINAPTEMISMTGAIWGANNLGLEKAPWLLSTDEQKNGLIMGTIFAKTSEQIQRENGRLVEISDAEMHGIYNPYMGITMPLGKFFMKCGIKLKEKWDKFNARHEYRMKELDAGIRLGNNPKKLIVENWRQNVAYLITFPRTSSAQNLSPKALALEYWLKIQNHKIPFYRISDGLFLPELFADSIPYVELNGQKLEGTTRQIIEALNGAKIHFNYEQMKAAYLLAQLEMTLLADRSKGQAYLLSDQGLIRELISTMSQLFPKLVEYEADYVDSWDTMPAQLKGTFNKMGAKIVQKMEKMQNELKEMNAKLPEKRNEPFESEPRIIEKIEEIVKILSKNKGDGQHNQRRFYLFGNKATHLDAELFGLLVQFFETPLNEPKANEYFAHLKNDPNNILNEYYRQRCAEMGGMNSPNLWPELRDYPWPLNFDFRPEEQILEENKNSMLKFAIETEKYNGQFAFRFVRMDHQIEIEHEIRAQIQALEGIGDISVGECPVAIGPIRTEMRAQKVNHEWLGSLWKVEKKWAAGEFERELEKRIEGQKRELYRKNASEKILLTMNLGQKGEGHENVRLTPVLSAVVEKLLEIVWESSSNLAQLINPPSHPPLDLLDAASRELGHQIGSIIGEYMGGMAIEMINSETDEHIFEEFAEFDKTRELTEKYTKTMVLEKVNEFYEKKLKKKIVGLLGIEERKNERIGQIEGEETKEIGAKEKGEFGERIINEMEKPTVEQLARRVNLIFDWELSGILSEALNWTMDKDLYVEQTMLEEIGEMMANSMGNAIEEEKITMALAQECAEKLVKRQLDARKYINKNLNRIGSEKSKRGIVDRMQRLFDRYVNAKQILSQNCPKYIRDQLEIIKKMELKGEAELMRKMDKSKINRRPRSVDQLVALIIGQIGDEKWRGKMTEKREQFREAYNSLEKRRKEKLGMVADIFAMNEKMRELVTSQIGQIDLQMEREKIEEKLGEERFTDLRVFLDKKMAELGGKNSELKGEMEKELNEILDAERKIIKIVRKTLKNPTKILGGKQMLKEIQQKYGKIEKLIDKKVYNGQIRDSMRKEIGEKFKEIEAIIGEISAFLAKYGKKNAKQMILEAIGQISPEMVHQRVRIEKFKIWAIKWEKKLTQTEIKEKMEGVADLLGLIREKVEIDQMIEGMARIGEKIGGIKWEATEKEFLNSKNLATKLDILGVTENTKTAKLLEIVDKIDSNNQGEIVMEEIGKMFRGDLERRRIDKLKKAKYPIAKAVLHLMGNYLCEGKECSQNHFDGAKKALKELNTKINPLDLLPAVKKLVFYTIGDFNENNVIREEILEQYGKPMENIVNDTDEQQKPFWQSQLSDINAGGSDVIVRA